MNMELFQNEDIFKEIKEMVENIDKLKVKLDLFAAIIEKQI